MGHNCGEDVTGEMDHGGSCIENKADPRAPASEPTLVCTDAGPTCLSFISFPAPSERRAVDPSLCSWVLGRIRCPQTLQYGLVPLGGQELARRLSRESLVSPPVPQSPSPTDLCKSNILREPRLGCVFQMWNNSKSPIKYTWGKISDCHIIEVEPCTGTIGNVGGVCVCVQGVRLLGWLGKRPS